MVVQHALQHGNRLGSLDIESAYLQVHWSGVPHYLRFPPALVAVLPGAARTTHARLRNPVYPMLRAIYGHPVSGKLFIEDCLSKLRACAWVTSEADQAVMVRRISDIST